MFRKSRKKREAAAAAAAEKENLAKAENLSIKSENVTEKQVPTIVVNGNRNSSKIGRSSSIGSSSPRGILKNSTLPSLDSSIEIIEFPRKDDINHRSKSDGSILQRPLSLLMQDPSNTVCKRVIKVPEIKHKYFAIELRLPELAPMKPMKCRIVKLTKTSKGDFGFTLRTSCLIEKKGNEYVRKSIHFAEPVAHDVNNIKLVPGDRLLEVNGVSVEELEREKVVELIRNIEDNFVDLLVQTVPELIELSERVFGDDVDAAPLQRSGSKRRRDRAKSEREVTDEGKWVGSDCAWLSHSNGYSNVRILSHDFENGKITVQPIGTKQKLEVDDDDVEKTNPISMDTSENLSSLCYLNESSVLHVLRQRYSLKLPYTYAGTSLVSISPNFGLSSMYGEPVVQLFSSQRLEESAPHIYGLAQHTYRTMLTTRRDQSMVLLGRAGSGKSTHLKYILQYLALNSGTINKLVSVEKVNSSQVILDAFASAKTSSGFYSSRFTQIFTAEFDYSGILTAASIEGILLEKTRIVRHAPNEYVFSVFYQMLLGCDDITKKQLFLDKEFPQNPYINPLTNIEDIHSAVEDWGHLLAAFRVLDISQEEIDGILSVLGAIYHLTCAGAVKKGNKYEFKNSEHGEFAAKLLGTKVPILIKATFYQNLATGSAMRLRTQVSERDMTSTEMLEGMITGLYGDLFNAILSLLNRSFQGNYRTNVAIHIVDSPGLSTSGQLHDLCFNYTQERLQHLFHNQSFISQLEIYKQEDIDINFEPSTDFDPATLISAIDQESSPCANDDDGNECKGLFWLLDEEAMFPGSTEESFIERLGMNFGNRSDGIFHSPKDSKTLTVRHCQGTAPVHYDVSNWLKHSRENPVGRMSLPLLQESTKLNIGQLFARLRSYISGTMAGSSMVGMENSVNLRRQTSIRKGFANIAGVRRKSMCLQVKYQLDFTLELLKCTRLHFVFCLSPSPKGAEVGSSIDVPDLRSQIQSLQLIDAIRVYKQGFPDWMSFVDFRRRFELLLPSRPKDVLDERKACQEMLNELGVDKSLYALGLSRVFLRPGLLCLLEDGRDEKLTDVMVAFQCHCRGFLAKQNLRRRVTQFRAVTCIQRNIRKWQEVQDWQWWRLYTKLHPLVKLRMAEQTAIDKDEVIAKLQAQVNNLTQANSELKRNFDLMEAKVIELTTEVSDEATSSQQLSDLYETEMVERRRLEMDNTELRSKYTALANRLQKTEMELMEAKISLSSLNDIAEEDGDEIGTVYYEKYVRLKRQSDLDRRNIISLHENEMETLQNENKTLIRKLREAKEQIEDLEHKAASLTRKSKKAANELKDLTRHLEDECVRNSDLERKQRRVESEKRAQEERLSQERFAREKTQRDRDMHASNAFKLSQELKEVKEELDESHLNVKNLTNQLEDLNATQSESSASEVYELKRQIHIQENKIRELEDELDDANQEINTLEQGRLRLDLETSKRIAQLQRDIETREEEMTDAKEIHQKRMRALETQLEEENEERYLAVKEKRNLERRVKELMNEQRYISPDRERELKNALHKMKVLLVDAQRTIDALKANVGSKNAMRQLEIRFEEKCEEVVSLVKTRVKHEEEIDLLSKDVEDLRKNKIASDEHISTLNREVCELQDALGEQEGELDDLLRKYKHLQSQSSLESQQTQTYLNDLRSTKIERENLEDELNITKSRLARLEASGDDSERLSVLECKVRDFQNQLELERSVKERLEGQIKRLKTDLEMSEAGNDRLRESERVSEDKCKRMQSGFRDLKSDVADFEKREKELQTRKLQLTSENERLANLLDIANREIQLSNKRIESLSHALQNNSFDSDDDDDLYLGGYSSSDATDEDDDGEDA